MPIRIARRAAQVATFLLLLGLGKKIPHGRELLPPEDALKLSQLALR